MTPGARAENFMLLDEEWLETSAEPVIEPDLEIIDAHHHLFWSRPFAYRAEHVLADAGAGHNILATVCVEAERGLYRRTGPEALRSVGETEFARGAAAVGASIGASQICARIIGQVDVTGPGAQEALEAHLAAGGGRFAGIRVHGYRDEAGIMSHKPPEHALLQPQFQQGFRLLQEYGLVCDIVAFHPQLPDVARLAEAFPDVNIIVNHAGGALGIGQYAGRWPAVREDWLAGLHELAKCPNVYMKLGGLANRYTTGISFRAQETAPSSDQLAEAFAPYVHPVLCLFGPDRCMFESDFPIEKLTCSYVNIWNAFKKLTTDLSPTDKSAVFAGTAAKVYGMGGALL
jgi:predicted TIM-barrel fold metal-dependent hydrolase